MARTGPTRSRPRRGPRWLMRASPDRVRTSAHGRPARASDRTPSRASIRDPEPGGFRARSRVVTLEVALEPIEQIAPPSPSLAHPVDRSIEAQRSDRARARPAVLRCGHEPRVFEQFDVLERATKRHLVHLRESRDRWMLASDLIEHRASGGAGEGRERGVEILNHMDQYWRSGLQRQGLLRRPHRVHRTGDLPASAPFRVPRGD